MEDILLGAVALDEERYRLVPIRAGQPIRGPVIRAPALVFRLNGGTTGAEVVNVNAAHLMVDVDAAHLMVDVDPNRCWRGWENGWALRCENGWPWNQWCIPRCCRYLWKMEREM